MCLTTALYLKKEKNKKKHKQEAKDMKLFLLSVQHNYART